MAATDRPFVFEGVQLGAEVTPSTPVAGNIRLGSASIELSPNIATKTNTPKGMLFPTSVSVTQDSTTGKISGVPAYPEMPFFYQGVVGKVTPTPPVGTTMTQDYAWYPMSTGPDTPVTYSLEQGSDVRAMHAVCGLISDFGLTWNRASGLTMDGAIFAKQLLDDKVRFLAITGNPTGGSTTITVGGQTTTAIAPNATAAAVQSALEALSSVGVGNVICTGGPLNTKPIRIVFIGSFEDTSLPTITWASTLTGGTSPAVSLTRMAPSATQLDQIVIDPNQIDVYAATTAAGLNGAPKLTRAFAGAWKLANRWAPIWAFNTDEASFADFVQSAPKGEGSVSIGADDVGMSFLAKLRKGNTAFFRFAAKGPIIETVGGTVYRYGFTTDMALKLTKVSPLKNQGSLVSVDYSGEFTHDPIWNKATAISLRTKLLS